MLKLMTNVYKFPEPKAISSIYFHSLTSEKKVIL